MPLSQRLLRCIMTCCLVRRRLAPDRLASAESSRDNIETSEVLQTRTFDSIHITLNIDTGSLLPLALR